MAKHSIKISNVGTGRVSAGSALRHEGCVRPACHPFFKHFSWKRLGRSGQQAAEYGLLIVAISTALTMMYIYTKRGLQSTVKDLVDNQIGPQYKGLSLVSPSSHTEVSGDMDTLSSGQTSIHKEPFSVTTSSNSFSSATGWSEQVGNEL